MNKRLKKLRKEILKISQEKFAEKINLEQPTIGNYESGKREIPNRVITDICREFNVNENWIRTGEEPILVQRTQKDEMKDKISKIIDKLDEEEISILQGIAEKIKGII